MHSNSQVFHSVPEIVVGDIRLQLLSPTLLRVEHRGAAGFEDRCTFTVTERAWPGVSPWNRRNVDGAMAIDTEYYRVVLSPQTLTNTSFAGLRVESPSGDLLFTASGEPLAESFFPEPGKPCRAWALPDAPRLVPPPWGATPPPHHTAHSGWDPDNAAPDLYIFIPGSGGWKQVRADFLRLTGRIPLPPLYSFGMMDSRYHAYSEETALEVLDTYRRKEIPLDVFVLDTDWRVGASHGYEVDRELFPDMKRFLRLAHERHVRVMFNDHPEPVCSDGLDPREFEYRWEGLTSILSMDGDILWYDRNWQVQLADPIPGLDKNVWGQRLYHDIVERYQPGLRPLIMSNVQGIDNGALVAPAHPASHRFPIWWTGDTFSNWEHLRRGIGNAVNSGILSMIPFINEDTGGHHGTPSPTLYLRFLQYAVFSPAVRVHCGKGFERFPWSFGTEVEDLARELIRLRYRLLPLIYSAARQAYDDGTPLLRRCDWEWPESPEASDSTQYLFGDDLLVAPIITGNDHYTALPASCLQSGEGSGITAEYFDNLEFEGTPLAVQIEPQVNMGWRNRIPPPPCSSLDFSIRWTGAIRGLEESGIYRIGLEAFGGYRLWIADRLVLDDAWPSNLANFCEIALEKGKTYPIRLEYHPGEWKNFLCRLVWVTPGKQASQPGRTLWLPPGEWLDVWTEQRLTGPRLLNVPSALGHIPLYVRGGGIIFSIPQRQHTEESPWSEVVIDAYASGKSTRFNRKLYEDDGLTPAYKEGAYCETDVTLESTPQSIDLEIGPMKGNFEGAVEQRSWIVRLRLPSPFKAKQILLNGKQVAMDGPSDRVELAATWLHPSDQSLCFPFTGADAQPPLGAKPILQLQISAAGTRSKWSVRLMR